jgi:hypothetical protein
MLGMKYCHWRHKSTNLFSEVVSCLSLYKHICGQGAKLETQEETRKQAPIYPDVLLCWENIICKESKSEWGRAVLNLSVTVRESARREVANLSEMLSHTTHTERERVHTYTLLAVCF